MWLSLDFGRSLQEFVNFVELTRRKGEERASNFVGLPAERFVDCKRGMLFVAAEKGRDVSVSVRFPGEARAVSRRGF
ncbi:hypothetical protein Droror1_Dr00015097, partial [Drosera rotundifolia]